MKFSLRTQGVRVYHRSRSSSPFTAEDMMSNSDKRKQSLYFPEEMLREIQQEAARLDRSLSWVVQQGWKLARERIKAFPAIHDGLPDPREEVTQQQRSNH